jgi:hypothetical protein
VLNRDSADGGLKRDGLKRDGLNSGSRVRADAEHVEQHDAFGCVRGVCRHYSLSFAGRFLGDGFHLFTVFLIGVDLAGGYLSGLHLCHLWTSPCS